jgi:hypothetical protein
MLVIQNVRTDVGIEIREYTLCDGGLSSPMPNGDGKYYAFHWDYKRDYKSNPKRFKFLLDREPVEGKPSIYRIRLYDIKLATRRKNRDGFVFETHVGKTLLKDKVKFYTSMLNTMEQYI